MAIAAHAATLGFMNRKGLYEGLQELLLTLYHLCHFQLKRTDIRYIGRQYADNNPAKSLI